VEILIPGWGRTVGRHIEKGNMQGSDHDEQQDAEACLDGLTGVFLPNDDLSISINHARLKCGGILLPKL